MPSRAPVHKLLIAAGGADPERAKLLGVAVKDAVGKYGEQVAARYLAALGLTVVERNWRSPDRAVPGELDIIADDRGTAVIVEVKTRRSASHGTALEAVTPRKVARLRRLAGVYLHQRPGVRPRAVRIDVVAVQLVRQGAPLVHHLSAVG